MRRLKAHVNYCFIVYFFSQQSNNILQLQRILYTKDFLSPCNLLFRGHSLSHLFCLAEKIDVAKIYLPRVIIWKDLRCEICPETPPKKIYGAEYAPSQNPVKLPQLTRLCVYQLLCDILAFTWESLYRYGSNWFPALMSYHMSRKAWDEITYPFPNFNDLLEFGDG